MRYRGATHVHSAYSYDGKLDLPQLKSCLKAAGFSFACLTEHAEQGFDRKGLEGLVAECRGMSDGSFVFIPGLELAFPEAHVLAIGVGSDIDPQEDPLALLKKLKAAGCYCVFAHPHRSGFMAPAGTEGLFDAIEVWNLQYDGKRVPRTAALAYLKAARERYPETKASAGLDFHREAHAGGPGTEIEARELEAEGIVRALKSGEYVLASGPAEVSSDGQLRGVTPAKARAVSAFSVAAIRLAKLASSWAKRLHLRPPKKLVAKLRRLM